MHTHASTYVFNDNNQRKSKRVGGSWEGLKEGDSGGAGVRKGRGKDVILFRLKIFRNK